MQRRKPAPRIPSRGRHKAARKARSTLAWTLVDGGADIDAQQLADKLGRYRKYLEGEQA